MNVDQNLKSMNIKRNGKFETKGEPKDWNFKNIDDQLKIQIWILHRVHGLRRIFDAVMWN